MKKIIVSAAVVASTLFLGGCAQMEEMMAKRRVETLASSDQALLKGLYAMAPDGSTYSLTPALKTAEYTYTGFIPERFDVRKEVVSGRNLQEVAYKFNSMQMDPVSAPPAVAYIQAIKQRGNVARLYKNKMGDVLTDFVQVPVRHFNGDNKNPASIEMYDRAPVIIEHTKDGRIVSFMLFVYQAQASFGAGVTEYTSLFMGPTMARAVENRVGNNVFANLYLRDL